MTDDRTIGPGPDPQPDTAPPPAGPADTAIPPAAPGSADAAIPPEAPTSARAARPSDALGAPAYEASLEPIATTATATAPVAIQPVQRPSRARWAVAALVALVVVAISAVGLFTLVGASSNAVVASWSPADAVVYVEVRGDLPGDQRQNLGRFLAHFPGFADQSNIEAKLDEALDKLVNKASDGKHDWTKEIKPWFGGEVALSMSSFPMPTAAGSGSDSAHALLVVTQKNPAAAIAWLKSLDLGPTTEESYKGLNLTLYTPGSGPKVAATATGGVLLLGDEASVKDAADRNGKDGLGTATSFTTAMAGIDGDQVTRTYVDIKAYVTAFSKLAESTGMGAGLGINKAMLDKAPAWLAFGGRFESDAIVSDLVIPVVATAPKIDDHESKIAGHLPASTIVLFEAHSVDKLVAFELDQLRADPTLADGLKQVEDAASTLGGLDHLVNWIGDVGIVVTSDGSTPGGGLVIVPTDAAAAEKVVTELRNLAAVAGSSSGVTTRDEPYGAGTITTIDFGDLTKLTGSGGAAMGIPLTGHAEVSYTVQGGVVIVGVGPAWVKSLVDVKTGSSLADQARYKDAIQRVHAKNASSVYVDLAAIRKLVEPLISQLPDASNYATETKPYVQPFDILVGAGWTDGDLNRARYVVTVTNP